MQLYKISFTTTSKVYIGISSVSANVRFSSHCEKGRNTLISKAIKKYGKNNAELTVLAECDNWELLCLCEIEAIEKYNSKHPNGYNLTDGGEGTLGWKMLDEQKDKVRAIKKEWCKNPDVIKNLADNAKKQWESLENRQIMSEIKKEFHKNNPDAGKEHSQRMKDYYAQNPEAKIRASEKQKQYAKNNPEAMKKHSDRLLGSKTSEETKLKMSEAHKRNIENDPLYYEKRSKQLLKHYEDNPEAAKNRGLSIKKFYEDNPDARKKSSDRLAERLSDPLAKIKHRLASTTGLAIRSNRKLSLLPKDYFNDKK